MSISGGRVNLVPVASSWLEAEVFTISFVFCHSSTNSVVLNESSNKFPNADLKKVISVACKQNLNRCNISAVSD